MEDATIGEVFDAKITDDEETQEIDGKKKKKRIKYKAKKLVINIKETKYHIVRYIAKKFYDMRLSNFKTLTEQPDEK